MRNRFTDAELIVDIMQRSNKAAKALFGESWPHEVARWGELIKSHQQLNPGQTEMEAIVGVATTLEEAPYNLMTFLDAAFEILTKKSNEN